MLGVLKGPLQHEFGWNEIDYGNLVFAFQTAYALGMVCMGRLIDRLGTRIGYAVAMVFWSIASMGHAIANSLVGFAMARAALGFGEAGVFLASIKSVAEWFPRKERALAAGIRGACHKYWSAPEPYSMKSRHCDARKLERNSSLRPALTQRP